MVAECAQCHSDAGQGFVQVVVYSEPPSTCKGQSDLFLEFAHKMRSIHITHRGCIVQLRDGQKLLCRAWLGSSASWNSISSTRGWLYSIKTRRRRTGPVKTRLPPASCWRETSEVSAVSSTKWNCKTVGVCVPDSCGRRGPINQNVGVD